LAPFDTNIVEVTFHSAFGSPLGASDAELASDLARDFEDSDSLETVASPGAKPIFSVLTTAGSVHTLEEGQLSPHFLHANNLC